MFQLSDEVRAQLIEMLPASERHRSHATAALNRKAARTGSSVYAGIDPAEKRRRRAVGKRQRAARKAAR